MSNFRKAPKLYHSGKKENKDFYLLPKKLMDPIFNQLNGKQGNQIKLMAVLLGTAGDGRFAVSEKWICDRTGMDQSSYNRARKALIERGWLRLEKGKLYVDFDAISGSKYSDKGMSSETETCGDSSDMTYADNRYNKEKQNKDNDKTYDDYFKETGERKVPDRIPENGMNGISRSEEIKRELAWIDLAIKYDEEMSIRAVEHKEDTMEQAEEQPGDLFDLDSILAGMFEEEVGVETL